jgi:hypothetical protein
VQAIARYHHVCISDVPDKRLTANVSHGHQQVHTNYNMKTLLVVAAAASLLVGCSTCPCRSRAWEYKTVSGKVLGNEDRLDAKINTEVSQGWQFVSSGGAADQWGFAILRRAKK